MVKCGDADHDYTSTGPVVVAMMEVVMVVVMMRLIASARKT